jgi:hypothetical protein
MCIPVRSALRTRSAAGGSQFPAAAWIAPSREARGHCHRAIGAVKRRLTAQPSTGSRPRQIAPECSHAVTQSVLIAPKCLHAVT